MKWVKATDRLPDLAGEQNKVIIRDTTRNLLVYGFKNFSKNPTLYFDTGRFSYLAVDGPGDGRTFYPIKNLEWLDESYRESNLEELLNN